MLYKGSDLILKDTSNNKVVAAAKSIELNINNETIEIGRTGTSRWREYITGRLDWSITVSTLVSAAQFKASIGMIGKTYDVKFTDGQSSTTGLITGTCICRQAKITEQKGAIAKGSFVFQGTGSLA